MGFDGLDAGCSLIPTFAVPLWIVLHLISLLQLHELGRRSG